MWPKRLQGNLDDRKLVNVSLFSHFSQDTYKNIMEMKKGADGSSGPKLVLANEGRHDPSAAF